MEWRLVLQFNMRMIKFLNSFSSLSWIMSYETGKTNTISLQNSWSYFWFQKNRVVTKPVLSFISSIIWDDCWLMGSLFKVRFKSCYFKLNIVLKWRSMILILIRNSITGLWSPYLILNIWRSVWAAKWWSHTIKYFSWVRARLRAMSHWYFVMFYLTLPKWKLY